MAATGEKRPRLKAWPKPLTTLRNTPHDPKNQLFPLSLVEALLEGAVPVRAFREYRGMRAGELAEKAGISQGYLSEIEAGKKTGSVSVLKRIAEVLKVELGELT